MVIHLLASASASAAKAAIPAVAGAASSVVSSAVKGVAASAAKAVVSGAASKVFSIPYFFVLHIFELQIIQKKHKFFCTIVNYRLYQLLRGQRQK